MYITVSQSIRVTRIGRAACLTIGHVTGRAVTKGRRAKWTFAPAGRLGFRKIAVRSIVPISRFLCSQLAYGLQKISTTQQAIIVN